LKQSFDMLAQPRGPYLTLLAEEVEILNIFGSSIL
jgi:hypothetical protein